MRLEKRLCMVVLIVLGIAGVWLAGPVHRESPWGIFGIYRPHAFAVNAALSYIGLSACYIVMGTRAWRARAARMALISTSLLVCLAVLEVPAMLSLIDYRVLFSTWWEGARDQMANPHARLDRELLFVHQPGERFTGTVPGDLSFMGMENPRTYRVDVQFDRNGFRNKDVTNRADIVLIGDSFVEGAMVTFDEIASSCLARALGQTVLNLGHGTYGPQQESATLCRYGFCAKPKVVVWLFFEGNDLSDYERYQRITKDWERYVVRQGAYAQRGFVRNALQKLASLTNRSSRNRVLASRRWGTVLPPGEATGARMYFWYSTNPLTPEHLVTLTGVQSTILAAYRQCSERGIKFLLAFAPVKYRVYHDLVTTGPESQLSAWRVNDLDARMQAWARSEGVPYVDMTPGLRAAAAAGTLVYFLDDGHWNAAGHAVVAREIEMFLKRNGWVR